MAAPYALRALAPVLIVDAVEPCVAFWSERLDFAKENEVPGPDGKLVFASVKKDGVEIMYQTKASVLSDYPGTAQELQGHSVGMFITVPAVAGLDVIQRRTSGAPVVQPRHDTLYGATGVFNRAPGWNTVGFAAFK